VRLDCGESMTMSYALDAWLVEKLHSWRGAERRDR
jgi:hypothetical protein